MAAAVAKLDNSFVSVSGCVCLGTTAFILFRQLWNLNVNRHSDSRFKQSFTCPPSGCHTLTTDRLTARNQLRLQISCLSECAGNVNSSAHFLSCLVFCKTPWWAVSAPWFNQVHDVEDRLTVEHPPPVRRGKIHTFYAVSRWRCVSILWNCLHR